MVTICIALSLYVNIIIMNNKVIRLNFEYVVILNQHFNIPLMPIKKEKICKIVDTFQVLFTVQFIIFTPSCSKATKLHRLELILL